MPKFGARCLIDRLVLRASLSLALFGVTAILWAQAPRSPTRPHLSFSQMLATCQG